MATTIQAGNATNGIIVTPDNTGALELKTGSGAGTTAVSISSSQVVSIAGNMDVAGTLTAVTPAGTTNTTQVATTAFVQSLAGALFSTVTTYNSSQRALGTTYTNSSTKPMFIQVSASNATGTSAGFAFYIAGTLVQRTTTPPGTVGFYTSGSFMVPGGATYRVDNLTGFSPSNYLWTEMV